MILRDTYAYGFRSILRVISNISRSTEISVDAAQQIRVWSGTVRDNTDFATAVDDIMPIYTVDKSKVLLPSEKSKFEGVKTHYHYATHNAAFSHSVPRFDMRARLGEIKAPTLVVVGRHDPITPVEDAQEIHDGIPGSVLAIFEKSGHSPPTEEPELFQEKVWGFLNGI